MTDNIQPASGDELAAVGYKTSPVAMASPEELARVGYIKPIEQHAASMLDMAKGAGLGFLGEASDLTGNAVKNVGTLAGSDTLKNLGQGAIDNAPVLNQMGNDLSPNSRAVGKVGADVLGAVATPGTGIAGAAIGGAAAGLAMSHGDTPSQVLTDTAMSAAVSFAVGSVLSIGSKLAAGDAKVGGAVATALKNSKTLLTNTEDYTNNAISSAVKMAGGDITKATPENVVQSLLDLKNTLKTQASSMYAVRDAAADSAGLTVAKSNVNNLIASMRADIMTGATPEMKAALKAANDIAGNASGEISFSKAETLSSKLSGTIASATSQGKGQLARELMPVKDALQADIAEASKANPEVMQLHDAATSFYKNSVVPMNNLGVQKDIIDNSMQRQFIGNLVKNINIKPDQTSGFSKLPDDVKMNILGSWVNILKENSSVKGDLDLGQMSKSIQAARLKNPDLFKQTNSFDQMDALAKVLSAKNDLIPKVRAMINPELIGTGFGAAIGHAVGGIGGAVSLGLGGFAVPIGLHLYSAGKMLNNEGTKALLTTMKGVEAYPNSFIAKETGTKISNIYLKHATDFAKKIGPVIAGGVASSLGY